MSNQRDNAPDDSCGHSHSGAGHGHAAGSFGFAFAIGIALNLGFVIVEVAYGLFAHSLALVADAGHNLADVLGLLLAWCATFLARTAPTDRRTYGLRSSSILAALFNAIFLLIAVGAIAWEAIRRFGNPTVVDARIVIWIAVIGIIINTV